MGGRKICKAEAGCTETYAAQKVKIATSRRAFEIRIILPLSSDLRCGRNQFDAFRSDAFFEEKNTFVIPACRAGNMFYPNEKQGRRT
jgi:hypothetical protein